MFPCELKFAIDLLKKCFRRFKELDFFSKQKFMSENPIDWSDFHLPVTASNFANEKIITYLDFIIAKEHAFIRNIFDRDELKRSKAIPTLISWIF